MTESGSPNFSYQTQGLPNEETATTAPVKGVPTMVTKTTVGAGLSAIWLTTVTFYDKRGHAIQSLSNSQLNYSSVTTVPDIKTNVPDFIGVPQISLVKKVAGSSSTTVQSNLTYDQVNRLQTITQQYNGGTPSVVAAYVYNEIGQQIQKNLGQIATGTVPANLTLSSQVTGTSTAIATNSITLSPTPTPGFSTAAGATFSAFISTGYLQTVDYRFNIRGQLLSINNSKLSNDGGITNNDNTDLFGMQFMYNQPDTNLGDTAYYDGKLSAVKWMSRNTNGSATYERAYMYSYDKVNRYRGETYVERATAGTGAFNNNLHGFDETGIRYDAGGNILTLNRNSSTQGTNSNTPIDALVYTYSTNSPDQLATVTDGTGANYTGAGFRNLTGTTTGNYVYDVNGNLTNDPYKGITLNYDVLNRTDKITVTAGTNQYINYTYDADGSLIRKQAYNNGSLQTTTDYIDGFVYINSTLSYFPMPEGRVLNNSGTLVQEFVITDQQGNARLSFQNNGSGMPVVKQENSYYGFGYILPNSPVGTPAVPNKQLYNGGSEWQNDYSNLPDYYQTFNRNYEAAIGRFVGVDPMAEGAESMTTYNYAGNNPIMFNDPLGDKARLHDNSIDLPVGDPDMDAAMTGGGTMGDAYDGIGRNSDPNWMNDGGFDDNGPFSSDGGAAGRAYYDPHPQVDYSTFWNSFLASGQDFDTFRSAFYSGNSHVQTGISDGQIIYQTLVANSNPNTYFELYAKDSKDPGNLNGAIEISEQEAALLTSGQVGGANQGGDQTASLDKFNTGAGAFGFGWGAKDALIDYAKSSGGSLEGLAGYAKVVKGVAFAGNVLNAGIVVTKVLVNRQIMPSDILDGAAAGASFIPGFGWAIGGAYFLGDLATKSLTGESIGQHLNDYYGDKPVVSW